MLEWTVVKQSRSESFTATAQINDAWVALELYIEVIEVTFLLICGLCFRGKFQTLFLHHPSELLLVFRDY